jgi:hypothetical protein
MVMAATGGYYVWKMRGASAGGLNAAAPQEHSVQAVKTALESHNFLPLAGLLAKHEHDRDNLAWYVEDCVDGAPLDPLRHWQRVSAQSALPHLALGARLIEHAWEARGNGASSTVSAENARLFEKRLRESEQNLRRAAELAPSDPSPWAFMLTVAKGLGYGLEAGADMFSEAVARCPHHLLAHEKYGAVLSDRWGGSDAQYLAFARDAYGRAGPDSVLSALICQVHEDIATYPLHFRNDPVAEKAYRARPEVLSEVSAAFDASLGRPGVQRTKSTIKAAREFAQWFHACNDKPRGRRCLELIGDELDQGLLGNDRKLKKWLSQS